MKEIAKKIENLDNWGCKTDSAIRRFAGDSECYIECVEEISGELNDLDPFADAIKNNDAEKGFEIAHYFKGSLANLGLEPVLKPVTEITEIFRDGKVDGADAVLKEIKEEVDNLKKIMGK